MAPKVMKGKSIKVPPMSKAERKRGRPAGKNRAPLSLEERRARNAKYEKERRVEMASAMADLAEAAGCDQQITNTELLAQVINRFQNAPKTESIEDMNRINKNLMRQIEILTSRIKADPELCRNLETDSDTEESSSSEESSSDSSDESESESESSNEEEERPAKIPKTDDGATHCDVLLESTTSGSIEENVDATTGMEENIVPLTDFSFLSLFTEREQEILEEAACSASAFFQGME